MEWLTDALGIAGSAATGGLVGALLRLIPWGIEKVTGLIQASADRAHELAMRKLDWDIAKEKGEQDIRALDAKGGWEAQSKQMDAWVEALKGQAQLTGVKFIDAVNQSVRPFATYYFLALYGFSKLAMFGIAAFSEEIGAKNALAILWTPADMQMLCGILGFWFVDRQLGKVAGAK